MKKSYFLLSALFCLAIGAATAQETVLHTFNDTLGEYPEGTLLRVGNVFYGTTSVGGANQYGCIFSMDTLGHSFNDIYDFDGTTGAFPEAVTLQISGYKLFGTCVAGGANDSGCVFSVDINGGDYNDILDFNGPNGAVPAAGVTLSGSQLFGMTLYGGATSNGCIFSMDTNGTMYKHLYDFNGTSGGIQPYGVVTVIHNKLYGMAGYGGANDDGTIFSIDSNGAAFTDLHDFAGPDGNSPNNMLVLSGTKLFGMTYEGGANNEGNIFTIDTNGNNFKDLLDLSGQSAPYGSGPAGDVIIKGDMLYGMAALGGATDSGSVFQVDTTGNNYQDLFDFNGPDGDAPYADLTISGNNLYGTTELGGTFSAGIVFNINLMPSSINTLKNNQTTALYPNPNNGQFTLRTSAGSNSSLLEVYNELGQLVYNTNLNQGQLNNTINIGSQPAGMYFYRVLNNSGKLVGEGKMVIE